MFDLLEIDEDNLFMFESSYSKINFVENLIARKEEIGQWSYILGLAKGN
jgi:hypothetical protein